MTLKESPGFTVLFLFMTCLLLCLQAGCTSHPPTASELRRLQGTWEGFLVGHEADGKITITTTGNSLDFHRDTNFWFETTFTLPAGTDPQQLHATIKDCAPPADSIGQVVFAFFKIEDGTMTLAQFGNGKTEQPKSFQDEDLYIYKLRKVQPRKNNPEPARTN